MKSVLNKAKISDIKTYPFPHLIIENAIDDKLCDDLIAEFPKDSVIAQGVAAESNKRFSFSAPFVSQSKDVGPLWKEFIARHASQEFLNEFLNLFGDHIKKQYPDFEKRFGTLGQLKSGVRNQDTFANKDVLVDSQICINTPVTDNPNSVKISHIDDVDKLYAGLFYLRADNDDSIGGDLELYKYISDKPKIHGARLVANKYVERTATVPYKKNTLVIFLNSPEALHGVTVRERTPHTRRFMNLVAEMKEPIFSLDKYKENVFDKIIRKLNI